MINYCCQSVILKPETHSNLKIMEQLLQFLSSIHPLSPALQEHLFHTLKVRELKKKDLLLKAGNICKHIVLLRKDYCVVIIRMAIMKFPAGS